MQKKQPTKKVMQSMQLSQNWDDYFSQVKHFLIEIPLYMEKYPGNEWVTWHGSILTLWEARLLFDNRIISTKGIKDIRLYRAFNEAKTNHFERLRSKNPANISKNLNQLKLKIYGE